MNIVFRGWTPDVLDGMSLAELMAWRQRAIDRLPKEK
ncbi:MAG TPA: GpE family phage tail protein [Allosphingosinicella sp.]